MFNMYSIGLIYSGRYNVTRTFVTTIMFWWIIMKTDIITNKSKDNYYRVITRVPIEEWWVIYLNQWTFIFLGSIHELF